MQYQGISRVLLGLLIGFYFSPYNSFAQELSCTCEGTNSFETTGSTDPDSPVLVDLTVDNWSEGYPTTTDIAIFNNSNPSVERYYRWQVGGTSTVNISGFVVEPGVTLEINRQNNNEVPISNIVGGCILVKSGATLNFSFYTKMENLKICVESGGILNFDSDTPGESDGIRDKFIFEDIEIIMFPDSEIKFGNAEIEQSGTIDISGYNGNPCILNADESYSVPPPLSIPFEPNIKVEIPPMTQQELDLFCEFLAAGTRIAPLPVEYIYFNSNFNQENRHVHLSWATAKEWENSHFEIERSINGVKSWEKVGQMEGRGWSDMPVGYEFLDEELPLVGGNVYYRLKQVDFDGTFAHSKVVSVRVPSLQLTKGVWRVYPNPTNGEKFRIELLNAKEYNGENVQIKLVNLLAGDKTFEGNNLNEVSNQLEDIFKRANKGVYVLEIFWGQKVEHIKVLKD